MPHVRINKRFTCVREGRDQLDRTSMDAPGSRWILPKSFPFRERKISRSLILLALPRGIEPLFSP